MSELLLDVSRLVGRLLKGRLPTGIDRVMLAYVRHYAPLARAVVSKSGVTLFLDHKGSRATFEWLLTGSESRRPWRAALRNLLCHGQPPEAGSILLNAGHSGLESDAYTRMVVRHSMKPLFLVHDLIPITHPELCREGESKRHRARIDAVLSLGSGVICNSQATLDELSNYCRLVGKSPPPMLSVPLAAEFTAPPEPACGLPALGALAAERPFEFPSAPYFVQVGTIEPRKNHAMILQVWQRLIERLGDRAPRLYLIGQRGWECEHVVRLLERDDKLRRFVIELGHCDDRTMLSLIRGARALLFPTIVEGFGMPIIEALAQDVPVIASDLPVFREFADDVPDYLDCLDAMRWMQTIEAYLPTDSAPRDRQLTRMRDFRTPSWSDHFSQVDTFMHRVVGTPCRTA